MRKPGNPVRRLLGQILAIGALIGALALAPIRHASTQKVAPSWSYTGSLNTTIDGHTATLLPDGKVLWVRDTNALLYDPSTGTWSVTGSLNMSRQYFTATLLGNGKVLVAGGYFSCCAPPVLTNTAELYDPTTGEWSLTGNLNVFRSEHTATLLPNGKVLVSGGGLGGAFSATKTAELYDPATGKWRLTGSLIGTRVYHADALLQNGKVLVAGGCGDEECFFELGSAEIYDPNTETWSSAGRLNTPRSSHALTMLPNGNVLMTGGQGWPFPFILNAAELYNPATGLWSLTGSLLKRRWQATATLLPTGKVLVAGGEFGYDSSNPGHTEVFDSVELYDPATGTWNTTASLKAARSYHSATRLNNGQVLLIGGFSATGTELYDPICPSMIAATGRNFAASGGAGLITVTVTEGCAGTVATVSAASYYSTGLAGEAIASSFGAGLATSTSPAATFPLPTEIAGTTVKVRDSAGAERLTLLFYVSPTQVNYQIPAGTATGAATVTITNGNGTTFTGEALIRAVAPSLFAANGNGQGVAAALVLRVKADGSQSYEDVMRFDAAQNKFVARPLDLGPEGEQVYLVLFGTGIRHRHSLSAVIASLGGTYAEVSYAGPHTEFVGMDQVNVLLPRSLIGRGEVDVLLTVEAQMANPVRVNIK